MSVHEEIGFSAPTAENRRKNRHTASLRSHKWRLIAQQRGFTKHRCYLCGSTRTQIAQADQRYVTHYELGSRRFEKAPPCQSVHVEQIT